MGIPADYAVTLDNNEVISTSNLLIRDERRRRLVSSPISVLTGSEASAVPSLSSLEESRLPEIAVGSAVTLIFGLLCYKAYILYRSVAKKSSSEAGDSSV